MCKNSILELTVYSVFFIAILNVKLILKKPPLKVYFWFWEHLCYQVQISRLSAKILGAQLKVLGAQLKILVAPKRKIRKRALLDFSDLLR